MGWRQKKILLSGIESITQKPRVSAVRLTFFIFLKKNKCMILFTPFFLLFSFPVMTLKSEECDAPGFPGVPTRQWYHRRVYKCLSFLAFPLGQSLMTRGGIS